MALARSTVELPRGPVRYHDAGSGPPLVFVHGLMVDADHWRKVIPRLSGEFRCIAPDLPFGAHARSMDAGADLDPPGVVDLLTNFLDALGLDSATLVGNDTGGAFCQLLVDREPAFVERLVLTPSDTFDDFLPPEYRFLQWGARSSLLVFAGAQLLRSTSLLRLAYGPLTNGGMPTDVMDAYASRLRANSGVRRDLRRVLLGISPEYTTEAARSFPDFDRPVLVVWGPDDPIFPIARAHRVADLFPDARLVELPGTYCFVPEDRPDELVEHVRKFAAGRERPA